MALTAHDRKKKPATTGETTIASEIMVKVGERAKEMAEKQSLEKKSKKKRKRKRGRRSSSTSSSMSNITEDEDKSKALFRAARGTAGTSRVKELQRRAPGALLKEGLEAMRSFVSAQGGRTAQQLLSDPVAVAYFQTCLKPSLGDKISARNDKEMGVLVEVLDMILVGDFIPAAELVLQRFKALETKAHEGSWSMAQHLELSRPSLVSCVSSRELDLAKQTQGMEERLRGSGSRGSGG